MYVAFAVRQEAWLQNIGNAETVYFAERAGNAQIDDDEADQAHSRELEPGNLEAGQGAPPVCRDTCGKQGGGGREGGEQPDDGAERAEEWCFRHQRGTYIAPAFAQAQHQAEFARPRRDGVPHCIKYDHRADEKGEQRCHAHGEAHGLIVFLARTRPGRIGRFDAPGTAPLGGHD